MKTLSDYAKTILPSSYEESETRFEFLKTLDSGDYFTFKDTPELKWAFWEDGSGNEGRLILLPETKQAIVYGYDHESELNFFDDDVEKQKVFNQFPDSLKTLLNNGDFNWDWDEDSDFVYATVGFWLDENGWHCSEDYENQSLWTDGEEENQYDAEMFTLNLVTKPESYWVERFSG